MPNSSDIIKLMNSQHEEKIKRLNGIESRLDGVETQVKYTNGRVTRMEEKWAKAEAVEDYKKQQQDTTSPVQQVRVDNSRTDWKMVAAGGAAFFASVVYAVSQFTGGN